MKSQISRSIGKERREYEARLDAESLAKLAENLQGKIPRSSRTKHQMTVAEYINLMKKQMWRCVICQKEFAQQPTQQERYDSTIDHDHQTGKIRGLLCRQCNAMLGNARDNSLTLANGILYLFKHINSPEQNAKFDRKFVEFLDALRNRITRKKGFNR